MASKYLIATGKRHLFNPAAFGAALMGIGFHRTVSWWVGDNAVLLPLILLGGALILTRLRYSDMLAAFALVVLGLSIAHGDLSSLAGVAHALSMMAIHSMFCFFGLVMLTEPRTVAAGPLAADRLWRAGRAVVLALHACRQLLFHARSRHPVRQSLCLPGQQAAHPPLGRGFCLSVAAQTGL